MYLPPLSPEEQYISTWEYRRSLLQDRISLVDADVVCFQEVSPLSFEEDFSFMSESLGYDGVELFRKVCGSSIINEWMKMHCRLIDSSHIIRVGFAQQHFGRRAELNLWAQHNTRIEQCSLHFDLPQRQLLKIMIQAVRIGMS